MTPADSEKVLAFLQQESATYDANVRAILAQVYQFGALGFGLLGAGATLLADKQQYSPLLAIPPLGLVIWLMGIRALSEMYALAAHRDYIEQRTQEVLADMGKPGLLVRWESVGGRVSGRSPQNYATFGAFAVVQIVTAVGCFIGAWRYLPHLRWLTVVDSAACAVVCGATLWLVMGMLATFDRVTSLLATERGRLTGAP